MRLIMMVSLLTLLVTACYPLSPAYYQPSGPTHSYFKKPGASELEVKKAMLECGIADINGAGNFKQDMNSYFLAKSCLEKAGYKSTVLSMEESCQLEHNKQYPACQPDAVIPKPSVERRLNSQYCRYARGNIDPVEFGKCLEKVKYLKQENLTTNMTEKTCVYHYKELRAECRP